MESSAPTEASDNAVQFIAGLIRLQREVREVGQQLDRIEVELHQALDGQVRERFEEYR